MLHHLALSLARSHDEQLQNNLQISFSQYKILMIIKWTPSLQQNQIAKQLGVTEASISRQIKLMFDDGLIQSIPDESDRRKHVITLTKRGERVSEQAVEFLKQQNQLMTNSLSKSEQEQLLGYLKVLHNNVCSENSGFCS